MIGGKVSYNEGRLRSNLDAALAEFMQDIDLMPGTREAVVDSVMEQALITLRFFCGDSSIAAPRGLITSPTRHRKDCQT